MSKHQIGKNAMAMASFAELIRPEQFTLTFDNPKPRMNKAKGKKSLQNIFNPAHLNTMVVE